MTTEVKAGLFTVIGIVVLLASIILLRGGFQLRQRGYELKLRMNNAAGITTGAPVLMAGVEVGRVRRLSLTPERRAELTLRIREGVTIPTGSRFATATAGVLGDRYVAITPGPPDSAPIPPDTVVLGADPLSLEQLFDRVTVVAQRAEETLVSINRLVGDPALRSDIAETVRNAREATAVVREAAANVERMTKALDRTVGTDVPAIARELRAMAGDLAGAAREIRTMVTDVSADGDTARQIRETLGNVQRTTARIDKMTQDLSGVVNEEQIRSIKRSIAEVQSAVSEARQTLGEARQGVAEVRQGISEARTVVGRAGAVIDRVNKIIPERQDVPGGLRGLFRLDYELWYAGTRAGHDVRVTVLPTSTRHFLFTWRDIGFNNRLGLQIGQRLENMPLTVRFGLIDGHVGAGLDYGTAPGAVFSADLYNVNSLTFNVYTYWFLNNDYAISLRGTNLLHQPTLGVGVLRRF